MRRKFPLTVALLVGVAPGLAAQQWSPAQQEVVTQLKKCWDTWMDGVRTGSPEAWIRSCADPGLTYWGPDGAPAGLEVIRRNWKVISEQDLGWMDLRPLVIKVFGDVAVVQFYGYWSAPSPSGSVMTEWKRTEVFRRVDGAWLLAVGHSNPVAGKDLEPYRD